MTKLSNAKRNEEQDLNAAERGEVLYALRQIRSKRLSQLAKASVKNDHELQEKLNARVTRIESAIRKVTRGGQ